jgi:hypothetical protein
MVIWASMCPPLPWSMQCNVPQMHPTCNWQKEGSVGPKWRYCLELLFPVEREIERASKRFRRRVLPVANEAGRSSQASRFGRSSSLGRLCLSRSPPASDPGCSIGALSDATSLDKDGEVKTGSRRMQPAMRRDDEAEWSVASGHARSRLRCDPRPARMGSVVRGERWLESERVVLGAVP